MRGVLRPSAFPTSAGRSPSLCTYQIATVPGTLVPILWPDTKKTISSSRTTHSSSVINIVAESVANMAPRGRPRNDSARDRNPRSAPRRKTRKAPRQSEGKANQSENPSHQPEANANRREEPKIEVVWPPFENHAWWNETLPKVAAPAEMRFLLQIMVISKKQC